jgi:hypothetical protein
MKGDTMGKMSQSRNARMRGAVRRRRRKRAEHREKTRPIREAINAKKKAEGHPGWVANPPYWEDERFW